MGEPDGTMRGAGPTESGGGAGRPKTATSWLRPIARSMGQHVVMTGTRRYEPLSILNTERATWGEDGQPVRNGDPTWDCFWQGWEDGANDPPLTPAQIVALRAVFEGARRDAAARSRRAAPMDEVLPLGGGGAPTKWAPYPARP